jgi:hypothetical protein
VAWARAQQEGETTFTAFPYSFSLMRKILLLSGLVSLPLLSVAQTAPARFYVGAGVTVLSDRPFHNYSSTQVGPALTAGLQFTPRLALQLSGAYTWRNASGSYDTYYGSSTPGTFHYESRSKLFTFPLLLRATFTDPAKPLRVDALFGPTWLHGTARSTTSIMYQGQPVQNRSDSYSDNSFSLALGPALRYTLTPRLELVLDALVNIGLQDNGGTFSDRLFSNVLAGVQYNFGE